VISSRLPSSASAPALLAGHLINPGPPRPSRDTRSGGFRVGPGPEAGHQHQPHGHQGWRSTARTLRAGLRSRRAAWFDQQSSRPSRRAARQARGGGRKAVQDVLHGVTGRAEGDRFVQTLTHEPPQGGLAMTGFSDALLHPISP